MKLIHTIGDLRQALAEARAKGEKIGLVPTMGALHAGHASLVRRSVEENGLTVVSVFLNPTQFNDKKDLERYPRTLEADCALLEQVGADIVFAPSVEEMYPEPDTRRFSYPPVDTVMEGAFRPGHFNGVCQIVSKLFAAVEPDRAYFGEKDFQQIAVIKELVRQLAIPVQIVECPIVREADGLALSSRNLLLTAEHRAAAPMIHAAMQAEAETAGTKSVEETERDVIARVEKSPLLKVIYFQLVDEDTLQPVKDWKSAAHVRGCIAVQAGEIRLIDNLRFL